MDTGALLKSSQKILVDNIVTYAKYKTIAARAALKNQCVKGELLSCVCAPIECNIWDTRNE